MAGGKRGQYGFPGGAKTRIKNSNSDRKVGGWAFI